jgi:hypothetical protein
VAEIVLDSGRAFRVLLTELPVSRESLAEYMRQRNPNLVMTG